MGKAETKPCRVLWNKIMQPWAWCEVCGICRRTGSRVPPLWIMQCSGPSSSRSRNSVIGPRGNAQRGGPAWSVTPALAATWSADRMRAASYLVCSIHHFLCVRSCLRWWTVASPAVWSRLSLSVSRSVMSVVLRLHSCAKPSKNIFVRL